MNPGIKDNDSSEMKINSIHRGIKYSREEIAANTAISNLITQIVLLTERKDPSVKSIKSSKLLIRGLEELQGLVEMADIKHSIVSQIKFLITNQARKLSIPSDQRNAKFEGHMLHSVISGNPGTGKTTVGLILAKIWMALGFVKKNTALSSSVSVTATVTNNINEAYRARIVELEQTQYRNHQQLYRLRNLLPQCRTLATDIRHQVIKLGPGPKPGGQRALDINREWAALLKHTHDLRIKLDKITPNLEVIQEESEEESSESSDEEPKFVIASRETLVAEYLGQTAPKTRKVLESARGGVLFIDEAYSICNMEGGIRDKYGEECINTINEFMSLYPEEIIIIFAGYKDKILNSIFKVQSGIARRITWFFEIKDYTNGGLAKIFIKQLAKNSWTLSPDIEIEKIIAAHKDIIRYGGGDTQKLALFVKIEYGNEKFLETVTSALESKVNQDNLSIHDSIITKKMIDNALVQMTRQINEPTASPPYLQMYT